jgi:hypothetical protein
MMSSQSMPLHAAPHVMRAPSGVVEAPHTTSVRQALARGFSAPPPTR